MPIDWVFIHILSLIIRIETLVYRQICDGDNLSMRENK